MTGRFWGIVTAVGAVHFVAQVAATILAIGGLQRFDAGGEAGGVETIAGAAAKILHLPLVTLARMLPLGGTGQWGWGLLVANSLLWGLAIAAMWRWLTGWNAASEHGDGAGAPRVTHSRG
ncbi:MAG: hypothetical protein EBR86_09470 [Planctomycetia bacterium]|nr:hypothetical protein [Planctomycetia bacterium]